MKKRYLMYAGIAAAAILIIMFIVILATGSFTIFPSAAIDPIPDHYASDLVVITGTTNYPAGTRLSLDILASSPASGEKTRAGGTDAFVVRGGGMVNTWSGALDTTTIPPGEYLVNAYWIDETNVTTHVRSSLLATSRIRLTNITPDTTRLTPVLVNHTLRFIHIDRPGTISRGEKILISGTTNLPEKTQLLYLINQQSSKTVFTVNPKTGQQDLKGEFNRSGLITVVPGENGVSRWSFAFDSTEAIPAAYEVIITENPVSTGDIGKDGTFGTAFFTILEAESDRLTPADPNTGPCQSIMIDTFSDVLSRRNYTITGTTSLQPGTELRFSVLPAEFEVYVNKEGMSSGSMSGAVGTATVTRGTGTTNTWSVDMDLAMFPPEKYLINISNDRVDPRTYHTIYGDRYCSKKFTLSG
ncbi:MAG: hypothetical protein WC379_14175 [Methanoregula sp.]|jgi:hypothetical protein